MNLTQQDQVVVYDFYPTISGFRKGTENKA